jgi:hypothetical protein
MAASGSFIFGMRFIAGYVLWSIVTGAGQWLALRGRLWHLPQKYLLTWLGAHCVIPFVIVQILNLLWRSLLPIDIDTPMTPWHYLIGTLTVLGPGLLHGILASGGSLLLLRHAQQQP